MKFKQLNWWTLVTLGIFLLLNVLLSLVVFHTSRATFARSEIAALVLVLVPLVLFWGGLRVGLYLLALVQALYLAGYCSALYRLVQLPKLPLVLRGGALIAVLIALGALLYWFRLAWQARQALTKERVQRYLKFRK
ncbi:hypothetical protein M3M35_03975 [Fructilactobacillus myrtifloralis]|uniref:Uncharacterized protein n=1 Tax=Fructilactobacillus myrtifloralis TaxID=2940301 RepID=A0ABY5BQH9_9LACO|nr:hypothetical protein [Fructilactobacillus myrtifloralis]USS84483.1 hypothetical protein M3M35_03975 [Fructilactobacillus myrtifloralis]